MTATEIPLVIALAMWLAAALLYFLKRHVLRVVFMIAGWAAVAGLLVYLWIVLGHPPMRSTGETQLWFACFLPLVGLIVEVLFRSRSVSILVIVLAAVFVVRSLVDPEAFGRTMMPALRSPWFIPHVVVYMVSYAALALAGLAAVWGLIKSVQNRRLPTGEETLLPFRLACIGFPLLTCGLLFGAFWAQDAWSDYWTWDPKEVWSLATWLGFGAYFHLHTRLPGRPRVAMAVLIVSCAVMTMTWLGVDILPSASMSEHIYGR